MPTPSVSRVPHAVGHDRAAWRGSDWIRGLTKRAGGRTSEQAMALLFLAPALAALTFFRIMPAVSAAIRSTESHSIFIGVRTQFVGLDNYADLLSSSDFLNSVKVTLLFCLITVPIQTIAALALAVLLTQHLPGTKTWRFLMFVPFSVPGGIATLIWGVAYRPDGPINAVLIAMGLEPQPFVTSVAQALPSIMILVSWVGIGYWMVFLIAGLQDVPVSYLEAAATDGAGWWRRFFDIVLPLLRRPLAFVLVADTVANFLAFAPAQALTKGGPQKSTDLIMLDIYENAYVFGNLPLASAEVVLLVAFMLGIVVIQFGLLPAEQRR